MNANQVSPESYVKFLFRCPKTMSPMSTLKNSRARFHQDGWREKALIKKFHRKIL